jgi:hypothetical protein
MGGQVISYPELLDKRRRQRSSGKASCGAHIAHCRGHHFEKDQNVGAAKDLMMDAQEQQGGYATQRQGR